MAEIKIILTLDSRGAVTGINQLGAQYSNTAKKAEADTASFASTAGKHWLAIGAAALGAYEAYKKITSTVDILKEVGNQVYNLQKITGLSAESASELVAVSHDMGINFDVLQQTITQVSRKMGGLKDIESMVADSSGEMVDVFDKFGIQVKDQDGTIKSFSDVFEQLRQRVQSASSETERMSIATQFFRNNAANLMPLLTMTKEQWQGLADDAKKYGLILSQSNVNVVREYTMAHRELDDAIEGLKLTIGKELIPVLTEQAKSLSENIKSLEKFTQENRTLLGLPFDILKEIKNDLGLIITTATVMAVVAYRVEITSLIMSISTLGSGIVLTTAQIEGLTAALGVLAGYQLGKLLDEWTYKLSGIDISGVNKLNDAMAQSAEMQTTLAGRQDKVNDKLAALGFIGPSAMKQFNEAVRAGKVVWDDASHSWEKLADGGKNDFKDKISALNELKNALRDFQYNLVEMDPSLSESEKVMNKWMQEYQKVLDKIAQAKDVGAPTKKALRGEAWDTFSQGVDFIDEKKLKEQRITYNDFLREIEADRATAEEKEIRDVDKTYSAIIMAVGANEQMEADLVKKWQDTIALIREEQAHRAVDAYLSAMEDLPAAFKESAGGMQPLLEEAKKDLDALGLIGSKAYHDITTALDEYTTKMHDDYIAAFEGVLPQYQELTDVVRKFGETDIEYTERVLREKEKYIPLLEESKRQLEETGDVGSSAYRAITKELETLNEVQKQVNAGFVEGWDQGIKEYVEKLNDGFTRGKQLAEDFAHAGEQLLVDMWDNPKKAITDFGNFFLTELKKWIAEAAMNPIMVELKGVFSGVNSSIASFFGGSETPVGSINEYGQWGSATSGIGSSLLPALAAIPLIGSAISWLSGLFGSKHIPSFDFGYNAGQLPPNYQDQYAGSGWHGQAAQSQAGYFTINYQGMGDYSAQAQAMATGFAKATDIIKSNLTELGVNVSGFDKNFELYIKDTTDAQTVLNAYYQFLEQATGRTKDQLDQLFTVVGQYQQAYESLHASIQAEADKLKTSGESLSDQLSETYGKMNDSLASLANETDMTKIQNIIATVISSIDNLASGLSTLKSGIDSVAQSAQSSLQSMQLSMMTDQQKVGYYNQQFQSTYSAYEQAKTQYGATGDYASMQAMQALGQKLVDLANTGWGLSGIDQTKTLAQLTPVLNEVSSDMQALSGTLQTQMDALSKTLDSLDETIQTQLATSLQNQIAAIIGNTAAIDGLKSIITGTPLSPSAMPSTPHASGLDYVPYNNYRASLHTGEAVVTSGGNKALSALPGILGGIMKRLDAIDGKGGGTVVVEVHPDVAGMVKIQTKTVNATRDDYKRNRRLWERA